MMQPLESLSRKDYVNQFYSQLPDKAFLPDRREVWYFAANLGLLLVGYASLRSTPWFLAPLLSIVIGHSMACIAFFAHDLSHGAVLHSKVVRYLLEVFAWGINFIPPRLWRLIHNGWHHRNANTPLDSDRRYFLSEATNTVRIYTAIFYPHRGRFLRWNPFVFMHFIPYILRNIIATLFDVKPSIVPSKPLVSIKDRTIIGCELIVLIAMQMCFFVFMERSWFLYLFAGPVSLLITSAIVMMYVFTNHFISPLMQECDPVIGTVTVTVPSVLNVLHRNFSYHTEHHLFPQMNPIHYPTVSDLLAKHYPDRYRRLSLSEAWSQLWAQDAFSVG